MQLDRRGFLTLFAGAGLGVAGYRLLPRDLTCPIPKPVVADAASLLRTWPLTRYMQKELSQLSIHFYCRQDSNNFFPPAMWSLFEYLKAQGIAVTWCDYDTRDSSMDMAVIAGWGFKEVLAQCQQEGKNALVVEQGFFQPRREWVSLGFNGLANYGIYPPAPEDGGARFKQYFDPGIKPWRKDQKGYALLLGQVPTDYSLYGLDANQWLQETADRLRAQGRDVLFRPHPLELLSWHRRGRALFIPEGVRQSPGTTLAQALEGAAFCVAYSSTAAVESVLAGVPCVVMCEGSVAWEMTSHDLVQPLVYPDRSDWCAKLAWKQWSMAEIKDGSAWKQLASMLQQG